MKRLSKRQERVDATALANQVRDNLVDIAQQQDANDTRQAANNTQTTAQLARMVGFSFRSTPDTYIGGTQALLTLEDAAGRVAAYWDATGRGYLPAGMTVPDLIVTNGLGLDGARVTAFPVDMWVDGYQVAAAILPDSTGRAPLFFLRDGRVYAPGGIVGLSVAGITTDGDGGIRVDGVRMVSKRDIVAYGHSMMEGAGASSSANAVLGRLSTRLNDGRAIENRGVGGNTSTHIAARASAWPVYVTLAANIPADLTAVEVSSLSIPLLNGSGTRTLPVTIAGVPGTLRRVNQPVAQPYTFTRTTAGAAVAVAANSLMTVNSPDMTDRLHLLWMGRNNLTDLDAVMRDTRAIIKRIRAARQRYLIIGDINSSTDGTVPLDGSQGKTTYYYVELLCQRMLDEFGDEFVDLRTELRDPATGRLRSDYTSDTVHLLDVAQDIVAAKIEATIKRKGW